MKLLILKTLRGIYLLFLTLVFFCFISSYRSKREKRATVKRRLKYFTPIMTDGFWGTRITWIARDRPLTDDELSNLVEK